MESKNASLPNRTLQAQSLGSRSGLTNLEAQARLRQYGPNALPEKPPKTRWQRFLLQFKSPLIYILLAALVIDLAIWVIEGARSFPAESVAIAVILLLNAGLGVYQEGKAEAALQRLKALAAARVWVLRDNKLAHLPATELAPGDVVRVEAGDRIPADGALREAQGVMVDESILTGESVPVDKELDGEAFSGTLLVRGKGYLEITRTGAESAMGRLATMIGGIEASKTPLERRLEVFGGQIAKATLALAILLTMAGMYVEGWERIGHILLFAVALAVAAVPEGLPAVLTLTLSLGVERMAKRKAVVRRLSAVEALGSVTVIATDKTGTLTENRMFVKDVDTSDTVRAVRAMVLANDAELSTGAGDPLELALLEYAQKHETDVVRMNANSPRHSLLPFDSGHKYMRVTVAEGDELASYLKGAPEVVIARSHLTAAERRNWEEKAEGYAREGFRVLALAWRAGEGDEQLNFLGLALLWDPPRPEVPEAIRRAQDAGIRVVMITGDHPATALSVAAEVGIPPSRVLTGLDLEELSIEELQRAVRETNGFARVAPEHKLRLVEALKASGEVVAMTGDGVNDAPALKRADVGVAMGQRGSDVSREVAHLVLLDDNFATIVAAIEEGRGIYENIQKFIRFLFSTNLALVLLVVGGAVGSYLMGLQDVGGGLLLPLTAVQLLWINIIADGPPALALGLDRNPGVMEQRPRDPQAPLLDPASLRFIIVTGLVKALMGGVLLVLLPRYGFNLAVTRSAVFLYESIAQLVFAYPSRRVSVLPMPNGWLHLAVLFGAGLQILTITFPSLRLLLGLEPLQLPILLWLAGGVLLSWLAAEVFSRVAWAHGRQREASALR
ncbi:MAG: cation-transporting P-type ATPase [Blastocatellia bacterium]|nr:cation-transporting P-type ATPase [Blastocatellia bacterium]